MTDLRALDELLRAQEDDAGCDAGTPITGRPHLHMAAPDWQEVAEAIDSWLDGVLDAPQPATPEAS
jgi:hypothetical protein